MNIDKLNGEIKASLRHWQKTLAPYQKANDNKALWQIANTILPFAAIWILIYFVIQYSILLSIPLFLLNAFFLVRIFIIQHDCGHQSFFSTKELNDFVGSFCSIFSFIPYKYWAKIHNFHHGHTGQIEVMDIGDIPTATVKEYMQKSWFGKLKYRIFRMPVITFVIAPMYYFTLGCRIPIKKVNSVRRQLITILVDNIWIISAYILLGAYLGWSKFFVIQGVLIFLFGIIAFWFFYVQHQHEYSYKAWKKNWDFLLSAIKGSSFYKLPRIMHWLTGNIGFHHIHHLNSLIPNYNLKKCFKENPIISKYATSVTFKESLKMMRYKLWDEEQQKMISFAEYRAIKKMILAN